MDNINNISTIVYIKNIDSYNTLNREITDLITIGVDKCNVMFLPETPKITENGLVELEIDFLLGYKNIIDKYIAL